MEHFPNACPNTKVLQYSAQIYRNSSGLAAYTIQFYYTNKKGQCSIRRNTTDLAQSVLCQHVLALWFLHFMTLFPFVLPKIAACMDQTFNILSSIQWIFKSSKTLKERTCRSQSELGQQECCTQIFRDEPFVFACLCCLHICLLGSTPKCSISAFTCELFIMFEMWLLCV